MILLFLVQCLTFSPLIHNRELFECPPVLSVLGNSLMQEKDHTETQVHILDCTYLCTHNIVLRLAHSKGHVTGNCCGDVGWGQAPLCVTIGCVAGNWSRDKGRGEAPLCVPIWRIVENWSGEMGRGQAPLCVAVGCMLQAQHARAMHTMQYQEFNLFCLCFMTHKFKPRSWILRRPQFFPCLQQNFFAKSDMFVQPVS